MPYDIRKESVWVAEMEDRPGALAEKLEGVTLGGANLEFIIARRAWNKPGAVVFVAPLHGAGQNRAARALGFEKALGMHSLRVEGPDKPGLAARIARLVAHAGINLRGWSAATLGKRSVIYFAFATESDANRAQKALKKGLK
ncbi:MAG: ACT domain-containing protein [Phycisphaerae bacterium]|nr:ACT domain-containing protein [Phycisphaerae bacterium]NUQ44979.1 ACT domain-containing protein [Phycisphaerae bacterium]